MNPTAQTPTNLGLKGFAPSINPDRKKIVAGYALALLAVLFSWGLRKAFTPVWGHTALPFIFFYGAIVLTAWYGHLRPAILAVVLSTLMADWFFMPPLYSIGFHERGELLALISFAITGVLISFAIEAMHRAKARTLREVVGRKQADEAAALLASIVASSSDAIISKTLDGTISSWNASAERMFGYTTEEIIGQSIQVLIPGDRREEEEQIISQLRNGMRIEHYETVRLCKNGQLLPVSLTISPIRNEAGTIIGVSKIAQDITERKKAEELLRNSETRLRELIEALPAAVYTTDAEGRITMFNQAAVTFSGRVPEIGSDSWCVTWKLYWPDGTPLPHDQCPMAIALREGRPNQGYEAVAERPDGSRVNFMPYPTPLRDKEGKLIGAINMLVDISERKRAEEKLAEGAKQQRALYELVDRLHRAESVADVSDAAIEAILGALHCDRASILLCDESNVMRFVASHGLSEEYRNAVEGHSPWDQNEKNPQPIVISDVEAAQIEASLKSVVMSEGIGSLAFIPLIADGQLIGKFMTYFDVPHVFSSAELDLSLAIARQLAFGIARKRIQEALSRSERELTDFFDNAIVGLHWVNANGIIIRANAAELNMLGYSADEYIGHHITEFHADRDVIDDMLNRLTNCEALNAYPARMQCKDGSIREVLVDSSGYWENGMFIHSRCFTRDVTDYKRAQNALQENEERLRLATQTGKVGIWDWDVTTDRISWTDSLYPIHGVTKENFPATVDSFASLIHPDDRNHFTRSLERTLNEGAPYEVEFRAIRPDGKIVWVFTNAIVIRKEGKAVRMLGATFDTTALKRAEQALRESQDRLYGLVSSAMDAVIVVDDEQRIVLFNPAAETMFGYNATEAIGTSIDRLIPVHSRAEYRSQIASCDRNISDGDHSPRVLNGQRAKGDIFPIEASLSPVKVNGEKLFTVIIRDISERKAAEAERERLLAREQELRQAAEDANRLKDEFLATMSHELRNPLNVILGYSELLLQTKESKESSQLKAMGEALKRNALAQSHLIRDLLDLSRLRSGKLTLNCETISMMTAVDNAVETVRAEAAAKRIAIDIKHPEEPVFVDGDMLRLEQILWNLLNNSVKFTPPSGSISVRLRKEEDQVLLIVEDTGRGIDSTFLPHVFEMFRQADGSTTRAQSGMGIGLALVRQLIELHNGTITAYSEGPGLGTRFIIRLPQSAERKLLSVAGSPFDVSALKRLSVLVVDDSEDTIQMLRQLLELGGATVVTSTSASEALEIASSAEFDVVLSDISMPGMDGFEFLRRLRTLPGKKDIPVLALTGFGRPEDVQRAQQEGFFSHLTKPFDLEALTAILQKLPGKNVIDESVAIN